MDLHNVVLTIIKKIKADSDFKLLQNIHKKQPINRKKEQLDKQVKEQTNELLIQSNEFTNTISPLV